MNIDKHVSLGRLYAASLSLERLPASSEITAASVLIQDAARDVEALIDSHSLTLAAAVQAERESIRFLVLRVRTEIDCRIEHGAESGGHLEHARKSLDGILEEIDARPSPAIDMLTDAMRKRDRLWCEALIASGDLRVIEAVTKYVIERRPESVAALVDGSPKAEKKENA